MVKRQKTRTGNWRSLKSLRHPRRLPAKLVAAENAWQTVDDALQIFGGNGYVRGEYMIERLWRDVRVARVYDGSTEVQQIVIAQRLRKGDVETKYA